MSNIIGCTINFVAPYETELFASSLYFSKNGTYIYSGSKSKCRGIVLEWRKRHLSNDLVLYDFSFAFYWMVITRSRYQRLVLFLRLYPICTKRTESKRRQDRISINRTVTLYETDHGFRYKLRTSAILDYARNFYFTSNLGYQMYYQIVPRVSAVYFPTV